MKEERSSYSYVPIIAKASAIMDYIALRRGGAAASEIMRHFCIPKTSCYRILHTLLRYGYLSFSDRANAYFLGPKFTFFSTFSEHQYNILREVSVPHLKELAASANETAKLSIVSNLECYVLQRIDGPQDVKVRVEIGTNFPLYAGASSKILLLSLDERTRTELIENSLVRHTKHTITEPDQLNAELDLIARQGYAVDPGEFTLGIGAVACPVRDHLGRIIAAVSVAYTIIRAEEDPVKIFLPHVKKTAEKISRDFLSSSINPVLPSK